MTGPRKTQSMAVVKVRARGTYHAARWLPIVAVALLTYVLYPVAQGFDLPPTEQEIADNDVIAPFDFPVLMTSAEMERAAEARSATALPVYDFREGVVDSILGVIDSLFNQLASADTASTLLEIGNAFGVPLSGEEARYLNDANRRERVRAATRRFVTRFLFQGVLGPEHDPNQTSREIIVRRGGEERAMARDSILTVIAYLQLRRDNRDLHPDPDSFVGDRVFNKILSQFFSPTLTINTILTEAAKAELRATIDSVKDRVREGERIITAHEVITEAQRDRLVALQTELLERGGAGSAQWMGALGQVLTNGLIVGVFWLLLMLYLPEVYSEYRQTVVLASLFALTVIGAWANAHWIHPGPEIIPIPFAAIAISVLFNGRLAMVAAIVLAVLLGSQALYGGQDAFYIALLGGVAAALSVRRIRRRTHILVAAAAVTGAFTLAAATVALRLEWSLADFTGSVARGAANAVLSASLALLALPILELGAKVTTDLTLLELSDPSRPLLRRLATEVPGTYAHSLAVANLSEAACNAIGANGLLARVGCYYHDIGKLHRPVHFAENQSGGGNPHDRLPPQTSATIIREHVTEGIVLAERAHLPDAVKCFIPEHHGTREITYFLDRARKLGEFTEDQAEQFSYPGPRPRSAETAITMLADGVEAAIRVIVDPTDDAVRGAIDHVVKQRVDEGQLDNAPLTLGQLQKVKDAFIRVLGGMHHNRIEYPADAGGITAHWGAAAGA